MASAQAAVQQPAANAQSDAADVRDPVVKVGAAVKAGLDEFNGPTEGAPANKDRQQTNATVRASGKASAAKATKCTSLSMPSSTGGGRSSIGQSIATVKVSVTASVRGMSRYLRICRGVSGYWCKGKRGLPLTAFAAR